MHGTRVPQLSFHYLNKAFYQRGAYFVNFLVIFLYIYIYLVLVLIFSVFVKSCSNEAYENYFFLVLRGNCFYVIPIT